MMRERRVGEVGGELEELPGRQVRGGEGEGEGRGGGELGEDGGKL